MERSSNGKIKNLTEKQLKVLKIINEKREVTAIELSEMLSFSRTAAVQHLQNLLKKGILESKMKGKETWYYIPTDIEYDILDFIEERKRLNSDAHA